MGLSPDEFSAAVAAVTSAFGDPSRRQIYLFARERSEGVTATEVAQRFELHANVARHHLEKLAAGGYLEVRSGQGGGAAGRPSKRYAASEETIAFELPIGRDDLVLSLLGRAIELLPREIAEAMAEDVGVEYGRAMAAHLSPNGDTQRSFRAALHAVADALTAHGFAAHAEELGDNGRIVSDHCPFGGSVTSPVVCAVDRGMVKGMLAALYGDTCPETSQSRALGDATCITAVPVSL
ncbi:MAG: helix-turn-helix domain-containing protein [Acidobacteria bacterium]|nr:helix-turn-helix domain-containing protein [Acidobacteriota bacterium]